MNKLIIALLLFSGLLSLNSCSTDFDMYAEYKDVTIVYGIADITGDTTWVKITKAYTGPGNALFIAQNPDSSNYPYKLDVNLVGRKNGSNLEPLVFDTITIHNKALTEIIVNEYGDTIILNPFYSPDQLVYYAVGDLDSEANYTLNINKKDSSLSATTNLVNDFSIVKPVNRISFIPEFDGSIEWFSAKNGKRNEVSLYFNYSEYAPGYSDTLYKSVFWPLKVIDSKSTDGGEGMEVTYSGSDFYDLLSSELDTVTTEVRWVEDVVINIACGSQVLSTYLDINSASGSLLEEVPTYTNVQGGIGVFASRLTAVKSIQVSSRTIDELVTNPEYDFLGFKYKTK